MLQPHNRPTHSVVQEARIPSLRSSPARAVKAAAHLAKPAYRTPMHSSKTHSAIYLAAQELARKGKGKEANKTPSSKPHSSSCRTRK